jgi:hypothetical protein
LKYNVHSYKQVSWGLQFSGWIASWALLLLVTPSAAFAMTNSDIVNASSPSSVYMRKGFELSDGSIKELVSHKTGVSLYYCNPVSVRANPNINARKITSINDGNFETFDLKVSASAEGWADVFKDGRHIGYSAQAVKRDGQVDNIICPQPKWLTLSTLAVAGVQFNAE